jgi:hypothetical protein
MEPSMINKGKAVDGTDDGIFFGTLKVGKQNDRSGVVF